MENLPQNHDRKHKYEANNCSARQIARLLKKISLHENDILLIRRDKFSEQEILEQIKKGVEHLNLKRVLAILVDDHEDIRALNQQQMNSNGWYSADQINKFSNKIHEHVVAKKK